MKNFYRNVILTEEANSIKETCTEKFADENSNSYFESLFFPIENKKKTFQFGFV